MERFRPIHTEGFLNPKKREFNLLSTVTVLQQTQDYVDQFVANKEGEKGSPGELSRVIQWDAAHITLALFDFTSGQQVGFTRGEHATFGVRGEYWYWNDVVIASSYERQGLAGIGREHKKKFLGRQVPGALFLIDTIEATEEDAPLVRRILKESGAVREYWDDKVKGKGAAEVWIERVVPSLRPVPDSIKASDAVFVARSAEARLNLGEELAMEGSYIFHTEYPVAELVDDVIVVFPPMIQGQDVVEHWQGVRKLWQAARASGYKPHIAV